MVHNTRLRLPPTGALREQPDLVEGPTLYIWQWHVKGLKAVRILRNAKRTSTEISEPLPCGSLKTFRFYAIDGVVRSTSARF